MFDAHSNFGYATILVAPAPANSGTSLQVGAGEGALFPAAPFNCTVWPPGVNPLSSNAEIVRVTAVVGDVLTIDRAQEGTTAKNIAAGWAIANTTTVKVFTDIEDACVIFAGTQSATGPFQFNDGNGITFGMDNGTITASVDSNAAGGVAISAGANSLSTGTVVFANANGITFGMDAFGSITASHNGITSQTNPSASASNGAFTFQTLRFSDANFVTFGTAPGGFITASIPLPAAQSAQPVAASASNGAFSFSTLKFTDAFNVTFGTSAGSIIFASVAPPAAGSIVFSAGASSASITGLTFSNSNGIVFGLNNGTVTASHNGLTSQSNQAASASNGSFEFQTLGFSNANGVTFGTSAGSIITASVSAGRVPTLSVWAPYQLGSISGSGPININRIFLCPLNPPCNVSFNSVRYIYTCSASASAASFSTAVQDTGVYSLLMGIYSRSVTNSTDANYNSIVLMTSQDYTIRLSQSYSSSSKSGTWAWQTDATGGSSSISFSTNSSQWGGGVANFNARLFINHPFPGTMSGGNDYFFARYWFTSASGQSITRALALSVYGIPINANSTNKSALYDTGNGNLDGNNQYYPGLGFLQNTSFYSTNILPASFDVVTDIANTNTLGIGGALQYLPFQLFL